MNYRYLSRWKFDKCRMEKRRSCQPKLTTRRPHSQPWSVCHILLFIYPFGFNELSYGYSSVIQIMLCMEHNLKGIVLIDELETHLHIELQSWLSFSHKFNLLSALIHYSIELEKLWKKFNAISANLKIYLFWENLFSACEHCKHIKGNKFTPILDCIKIDVDEIISFRKIGYFVMTI